MQSKKSGRISALTNKISRLFHKFWILSYCKFWRIWGWTPISVTCFTAKGKVNIPNIWEKTRDIDETATRIEKEMTVLIDDYDPKYEEYKKGRLFITALANAHTIDPKGW